MYHNGPLFLLIFSCGNCDSLKDVLSSSVDPLRPLLIYVLIVSAVAVTTEGLRKAGMEQANQGSRYSVPRVPETTSKDGYCPSLRETSSQNEILFAFIKKNKKNNNAH